MTTSRQAGTGFFLSALAILTVLGGLLRDCRDLVVYPGSDFFEAGKRTARFPPGCRGDRPYADWFATLIVLLGGGSKKRQQNDIERAVELWKRYKQRKGG